MSLLRYLSLTASDLVAQMTEAVNERYLSKLIKKINACNVLIVDELGYLSFDAAGASLLFQIDVYKRQEAEREPL